MSRTAASGTASAYPARGAQTRHRAPSRGHSPAAAIPLAPERTAGRMQTARTQTMPLPQQRREVRISAASRMAMYAFVAVAMVLLFAQIGQLAQIAQNTKQIATVTASIRDMKNESENLTVRLSMQRNINRVRDEALYRLGMIQPEDGQIRVVSLNVPSVDAQTQTASSGQVPMD